MKNLVLYFDDHRSSVDLEFEGRIFNTVEYGNTITAPGFSIVVDDEGDFVDDLDMNVQVGSYHETFVEYLFDELTVEEVKIKDNDD